MTKHKSIRLKEKGKEPMIFNTITQLSNYWNISKGNASIVLKTIAYYKTIIEKYNIESIEETYDSIVPEEYFEKGYKKIGPQMVMDKYGTIINVITGKPVKPKIDVRGFKVIRLKDGTHKYLHLLVAEYFVKNPLRYPNVRHINGDRSDNRAENLEWVPYKREPDVNYGIKIPQSYIDKGWRAIQDKGKKIYAANKEGEIICITTGEECKQMVSLATGYSMVTINGHNQLVHRIIAKTFIPNPYNLPMINHKNENKTDNRVENLEWCTNKYNVNYSLKKKYKEESCPIPIKAIKNGVEYVFQSINEASRFTEADTKSIRDCLKNKRKTAKGFCFSYAKKNKNHQKNFTKG